MNLYNLIYRKCIWKKYNKDVGKAKLLSQFYNVSYGYLISGSHIDGDVTSIEMIVDEIDWISAWSKKYPILASYQGINGINTYSEKISELL